MVEKRPIIMDTALNEKLEGSLSPSLGKLENPEDVSYAIELLQQGKPIAFQYRSVFGIAIDCANKTSVQTVIDIKKDPNPSRPFSGMVRAELFFEYINRELINPKLLTHFSELEKFRNELSTLVHIRAPLTTKAVKSLPKSLYSQENGNYYMHNLDTYGHPISNLVDAAHQAGIIHFGVTTANQAHIQAETTTLEEALNFLRRCDTTTQIELVLRDPTPIRNDIKGSWGIIDITNRPDGKLTGIRHGHIPFKIIEQVLGIEVDDTNAKPAAYPQADFDSILQQNLSPSETRSCAIAYMCQLS